MCMLCCVIQDGRAKWALWTICSHSGLPLSDLQELRLANPLKDILARVSQQSQGLPLNQRLPSKYIKKAGTVDLTEATLFVQNTDLHERVVLCAKQSPKLLTFRGCPLNYGAATTLLLKTLHALHSLRRKKEKFDAQDFAAYTELTQGFGDLWKAFGWKTSTWVHWVVRHSSAFVNLHKNIYKFSSIPTERRNVEFKLDVTHCYKGWKISRPCACTFGFAHVLNLCALDKGLVLQGAKRRVGRKGRKRPAEEE